MEKVTGRSTVCCCLTSRVTYESRMTQPGGQMSSPFNGRFRGRESAHRARHDARRRKMVLTQKIVKGQAPINNQPKPNVDPSWDCWSSNLGSPPGQPATVAGGPIHHHNMSSRGTPPAPRDPLILPHSSSSRRGPPRFESRHMSMSSPSAYVTTQPRRTAPLHVTAPSCPGRDPRCHGVTK
jgi:hypothetical protein